MRLLRKQGRALVKSPLGDAIFRGCVEDAGRVLPGLPPEGIMLNRV
jgi:hypothetical protein